MTARWEELWWRRREPLGARALLAPLLVPEALFRAVAAARGALFDRGLASAARAGAPVISVGGLTVGGAGKTPAAMAIAARLRGAGRRVAVLSRGYGGRGSGPRLVSDGGAPLLGAAEAGDEPVLLARRLPGVAVLCGPDRAALARLAVELGRDALVLDDGFQHRRLARDLDVVVIDAASPRGNGHCLPRGPNREPLGALGRAGLVWLSRVDQAHGSDSELDRIRALARELTGRPAVESRHAVREVLDGTLERAFGAEALRGRRVLLACGLARPEGFRRTALGLGVEIAAERIFPDHHPFTQAELAEALAAAERAGCDAVLVTEKDAVRLPGEVAAHERIRAVRVEAEIVAGEEALAEALRQALGSATPTTRPTATPTLNATSTSTPTPTAPANPTPTLLSRLPRRWLEAAGAFLGWLAWALRVRRRVALQNLALAFPEKPPAERRSIARAAYLGLGRMAAEFLLAPRLSRAELERLFVYEGWERFEEARARGKGVIACTAHFGNFELLAAGHNLRGFAVTMITRRMGRLRVNEAWRRARARAGVEELVARRGETLGAAIRALRRGRTLGYVIDQNQPRRRALFPTFFGVPAATSPAPAYLAMRTGATVVFVVAIPLGDGRHRVVIEGPLEPPRTGDRERDALSFLQDLNHRLERYVRQYPERWYWLHRRWKTRPEGEAGAPRRERPR